MRKPLLIAAVGVVVVGIGAGAAGAAVRVATDSASERQSEARFTDGHRADAVVSQADAERAASARHSGTITDTHLEDEGDGLRWEVKPDDGTQVWEVQIDARSGVVV